MRKKQFRTSVLIDNDAPPLDDLKFIQARGLKPTNLLRAQIKVIREREEGAPTIEGLQNVNKKMQTTIQGLMDWIAQKGLFQTYLEEHKPKPKD